MTGKTNLFIKSQKSGLPLDREEEDVVGKRK